MDSEQHAKRLGEIPADRGLVEALVAHGLISRAARTASLEFLHPHDRWGLWTFRLFLAVGVTLVLAGTLYFFAFNWARMPWTLKLFSIQGAVLLCVLISLRGPLDRLGNQLALLAGSMLVGIFLAVFGQVFQTGADAWELFRSWSLLTLGWALLSRFAPHWLVWLVVTNLWLVLWWDQAALPDTDTEPLIWLWLMLLNGTALLSREVAVRRGLRWLAPGWIRVTLVIAVLCVAVVPIIFAILDSSDMPPALLLTSAVAALVIAIAIATYRLIQPDMWALAPGILAASIIAVTAVGRTAFEIGVLDGLGGPFLLTGIATVVVFALALTYLRRSARLMAEHS